MAILSPPGSIAQFAIVLLHELDGSRPPVSGDSGAARMVLRRGRPAGARAAVGQRSVAPWVAGVWCVRPGGRARRQAGSEAGSAGTAPRVKIARRSGTTAAPSGRSNAVPWERALAMA